MNILHLQSDTGKTGGISNYIRAITANYYQDCNFHVNVFDLKNYSEYNYKNSKLHILPTTYSYISIFDYIIKLRKIIYLNNIDIIHSHALRSGFVSILIKCLVRCKVVHTNHGLRYTQKKSIISKLIFFLIEAFIVFFSDYYVTISKSNYDLLKNIFKIKKIVYVSTKIDFLANFNLQLRKNAFHSNKFILIGIGSVIPVKRVDNFINIAKELLVLIPNLQIEWYGTGLNLDYFKDISERLNINIQWYGNIRNSELINKLSDATALLVTSEYEVMPLSVLECFSAGVLVFSNDFRNVTDFISDKQTGIILNTNKSKVSACKIYEIIKDFDNYQQLILNAHKFFIENHYDSKLMSDEYFKLYKKLCFQY